MDTGHEVGNPVSIETGTDQVTGALLTPLYNINTIKGVKDKRASPRYNDFLEEEKSDANHGQPSAGKDISGAGRRPQSLIEVIGFFREHGASQKQAQKFYLYHEANGWTIGKGNAPVVDWKARAEYWILSNHEGNGELRRGAKYIEVDKEYGEPL